MRPVLGLSLRTMLSGRRLVLLLLLAAVPVAVAGILAAAGEDVDDTEGFVNGLLDATIIAAILPIVTLALATAAFGDEVEDRTLSYLVLKPIPRFHIVMPKLIASIIVAAPLIVASGIAATVIGLDGDARSILAVGVALAAGVVAYASIFTWAGLVTTRALAFGLVYVILWEGVVATFLGGVRYLSVRGYTIGILHGIEGDRFEALGERAIEFPAAIAGVIIMTFLFFGLAVRRLRNMDVP